MTDKIGELRQRVEIQIYNEIQDDAAGTIRTWSTVITVFAKVEAVKGNVTFLSQQIDEKITHKIKIRWQPFGAVTSENWILMNSRRFRIRNVQNPDERPLFLVLLCEEVFYGDVPFQTGVNSTGDPLDQSLPPDN